MSTPRLLGYDVVSFSFCQDLSNILSPLPHVSQLFIAQGRAQSYPVAALKVLSRLYLQCRPGAKLPSHHSSQILTFAVKKPWHGVL